MKVDIGRLIALEEEVSKGPWTLECDQVLDADGNVLFNTEGDDSLAEFVIGMRNSFHEIAHTILHAQSETPAFVAGSRDRDSLAALILHGIHVNRGFGLDWEQAAKHSINAADAFVSELEKRSK